MVKAAFKAVCPLEIGDAVAMVPGDTENIMYLPHGAAVIVAGPVEMHTVTDIAAVHYLKNGAVQFQYELDNNGKYRPYTVKMPVMQYAEAIKKRDDARKPQK
ncbi:MAG: hypothetical protein J6K15_05155 [Lachnospiraceae bacterium]|nr:hypothetical protein [Lachnospiraceae bacterium]